MSKHSFIITYDTETQTWEWDTEQEGNRLDGLTYAPNWSVISYEQVGYSREPLHFALEDELAEKIGKARRLLASLESELNSVRVAIETSPKQFNCKIRYADQTEEVKLIGIIPFGYEGETKDLPNDDQVWHWLGFEEFYEGYSNKVEGWEIVGIEVE